MLRDGLSATILLWMAAVFAGAASTYHPPAPLPASAPSATFSGDRAVAELRGLMPEQAPRPSGSFALAEFRTRLVTRLNEMGIDVRLQETESCNGAAACVPVVNVIATIPGESDRCVLLMAHYDTTPTSPGAGDNGVSIGAAIELVRLLGERERPYRSVVLLFTDAEEIGGEGSRAFFQESPSVACVDAVANFDGSGTSGPSRVLRVAPGSGGILRAYLDEAPNPIVNSIRHYLFDRLGSNTDFSNAMRAGLPGMDFTFVGSRWNYHSPGDRLEALDPATLQHHGQNMLAVVDALAYDERSTRPQTDLSYVTLAPHHVLIWAAVRGTWGILAISLLMLLGSRALSRPGPGVGEHLVAGSIILAAVATAAVGAKAGIEVADAITGARPQWPSTRWPWRLILYGPPTVAVLIGQRLTERLPSSAVQFASAWILLGLALASALVDLRLAAPLTVAAIGAAAACFVGALAGWRPVPAAVASLAAASLAGLLFLPLSYMAEVTYGFATASPIFGPLAVVMVPVLALLRWAAFARSTS